MSRAALPRLQGLGIWILDGRSKLAPTMIVVDASPAVHRKAGLGRYAEELLRALIAVRAEQPEAHLPIAAFYHAADQADTAVLPPDVPRLTSDHDHFSWRLRALLAHHLNYSQDAILHAAAAAQALPSPQLFHATEHLLPRLRNVPTVFTLHDLIFKAYPEYHLPRNHLFLQLAMPFFLRRADAIICVSECTRQDALKHYRLPEEKMWVIHEGVSPRFSPNLSAAELNRVRERFHLPERFLLFVGTIEPRKNLPTLFQAFKALREQAPDLVEELIIVGKQGWLTDAIYRAVHVNNLTGLVRFVGRVDDRDLPAMYRLASAFVFPSLYEGFGLPPLEAMACGTPVVASNTASLPEVLGEAAILVPPMEVGDWVQALRRVLTDAALRRELVQRGLQRAARFTWHQAASATLQVYEHVLARRALDHAE